jgi:hypothetical protein
MYPWTVRGQGCSATENVEYVSAACRARTERDFSELRWTVERARESESGRSAINEAHASCR